MNAVTSKHIHEAFSSWAAVEFWYRKKGRDRPTKAELQEYAWRFYRLSEAMKAEAKLSE